MGGEVIRYGGEPNLEVVPTGNSNRPYRNLHVIRPYPVPQHYLRPEYGGKFTVGGGGKASGGGGGVWCFSDPEMKRKKRVASYKAYGVEGKLKAKIRKGFRWIKNKCSDIVRGC